MPAVPDSGEEAGMDDLERRINRAATFLPMTDGDTLPCLEPGGVQVYAYFSDGRLTISAHYDTASRFQSAGTVPTEVFIGGVRVYDSGEWQSAAAEEHPHDYGDYYDVQ
jgi:hypothetical protein